MFYFVKTAKKTKQKKTTKHKVWIPTSIYVIIIAPDNNVAAGERLPVLHHSAHYIFISFGIILPIQFAVASWLWHFLGIFTYIFHIVEDSPTSYLPASTQGWNDVDWTLIQRPRRCIKLKRRCFNVLCLLG